MLGLLECNREFGLLDLGTLELGDAEIEAVDSGGVDVGVVDFGLGAVDPVEVSLWMADFGTLDLGLLDRLPHRELGLLPQRERVLLDCRVLGLFVEYVSSGRAHASKLKLSICESTARQKSASSLATPHSGSHCESENSGRCCRWMSSLCEFSQ